MRVALLLLAVLTVWVQETVADRPLIPGTGQIMPGTGDDFEDPNWAYRFYLPKSSRDVDEQGRTPTGRSANGLWFETSYRGQPDVIKRVPTPPGGLPGSEGSLMLRSLFTGTPGQAGKPGEQDELYANVRLRRRSWTPVEYSPSVVVPVYLPPFEQWERRNGSSFALRADVIGTGDFRKKKTGLFGVFEQSKESEAYWPGLFINFAPKETTRAEEDAAYFIIRASQRGDYRGPAITKTGWWLLGMSFTPDGQVHYYAKPGLDDFTQKDHIASHFAYGFRAKTFKTYYFNVFNSNNGKSWSTPWVVDDPKLYWNP